MNVFSYASLVVTVGGGRGVGGEGRLVEFHSEFLSVSASLAINCDRHLFDCQASHVTHSFVVGMH